MNLSNNSRYTILNNLDVYRLAKEITSDIFRITRGINRDLASQMQRASISVGSNIAEGYGRMSAGDLKQFFRYSKGSLSELIFQLEVCIQNYPEKKTEAENLIQKLTKLEVKMYNFINSSSKYK